MDFIAIDFETANEKRNSACSMGITVVRNNKVVEELYFLIKPPELRFVKNNIWIHGIYPKDVENEKTFGEIWSSIEKYFQNTLVVAHNAAFDMSVLRALMDYYEIQYPNFRYVCTVLIGKNKILSVENHKLNTLAKYVGHEFKHHHAGEDALACSKIFSYIIKENNIKSLVELNLKGGISLGEISENGYIPCRSLIKNTSKVSIPKKSQIINDNEDYFVGRNIVFTGPLLTMKRSEASKVVIELGGVVKSSVTKDIDLLITNINSNINYQYKSNKFKKVEDMINKGKYIEILSEKEFLKIAFMEGEDGKES